MAARTLKATYALEFKNGRPHFQYKIWEMYGDYALVSYLSWVDGYPTYAKLVKLEQICTDEWQLYASGGELSAAVQNWERENPEKDGLYKANRTT